MAKRKFRPITDLNMIMAARTITSTMAETENLQKLVELDIREDLKDIDIAKTTVENLIKMVNDAIDKFVGKNRLATQKQATQLVLDLYSQALKNLRYLKKMIENAYGDKAADMLSNLGYPKTMQTISSGDQQKMIELLTATKRALTPNLINEFKENNITESRLNKIIDLAKTLKDADDVQEREKTKKIDLTAEGINDFNAIYSKLKNIYDGVKIFSDNPIFINKLNFNYVIDLMKNTANPAKGNEETTPNQTNTEEITE